MSVRFFAMIIFQKVMLRVRSEAWGRMSYLRFEAWGRMSSVRFEAWGRMNPGHARTPAMWA